MTIKAARLKSKKTKPRTREERLSGMGEARATGYGGLDTRGERRIKGHHGIGNATAPLRKPGDFVRQAIGG